MDSKLKLGGVTNEQKKSGNAIAPVQITAKFQFAASEFGDLPSCKLGNNLAPLGDGARGEAQGFSCSGWPTELWIEECENVFLEHAGVYSMLNGIAQDAIEPSRYSPPMQTMGERIRLLRQARGMSQGDLSSKIGVTPGAISQWENGSTKNIKLETFLRLCAELGTEPQYLIFGPPDRLGQKGRSQKS
jgi:DNA-binding Xre family transcriptional regulator